MKKLPYARRQEMLEFLKQHDYVDIGQLSKRFNVSYMTIHRDIEELERSGKVERVYGGVTMVQPGEKNELAVPPPRLSCDLTIEERFKVSQKSKQAIAKEAASFVRDGDFIGMDPSTTTLHMCPYLNRMHITVVTNSISVALQFSGSPTVNVILLGGTLRKSALTLLGPRVGDSVKHFNLSKCFLSASSLSFPEGLTDLSMEEPEAKQSLIQRSAQVYALADETKIGQVAPFVVCDYQQMTAIITTEQSNMTSDQQDCLRRYADSGVKVIYTKT